MSDVDKLVPKYKEGDEYTNEYGATYRRVQGNWKLIRYPDGTPAEEIQA